MFKVFLILEMVMFEVVPQDAAAVTRKIMMVIRDHNGIPVFLVYEQNSDKLPFEQFQAEKKLVIKNWIQTSIDYKDLDLKKGYFEKTKLLEPAYIMIKEKEGQRKFFIGISYNHENNGLVFRVSELCGEKGQQIGNELSRYYGLYTSSLPYFILKEEVDSSTFLLWNGVSAMDEWVLRGLLGRGTTLYCRDPQEVNVNKIVNKKSDLVHLLREPNKIKTYINSRIYVKILNGRTFICCEPHIMEAIQAKL